MNQLFQPPHPRLGLLLLVGYVDGPGPPTSMKPPMSDNEGHGGLPPSDDDLSLPKATVAKMISGEPSLCFGQW